MINFSRPYGWTSFCFSMRLALPASNYSKRRFFFYRFNATALFFHKHSLWFSIWTKTAQNLSILGCLFMPVVGVEPTRVISTRDFEFSSPSLIWCHPVLSNDTPFPAQISIFTHLRSIKHQIFDFSLRFPSAPIFWFGTSKRKLEGYLGGMQS